MGPPFLWAWGGLLAAIINLDFGRQVGLAGQVGRFFLALRDNQARRPGQARKHVLGGLAGLAGQVGWVMLF